ncbi:MAG: recombinase family protein [Phocaeicola sp.]
MDFSMGVNPSLPPTISSQRERIKSLFRERKGAIVLRVVEVDVHRVNVLTTCRQYFDNLSFKPLHKGKIFSLGVAHDYGISGTNTKKRDEFNCMIRECKAGNIDMIIIKSISRFARNTIDCLNYVRQLKEINIPIMFEKENINTMDSKGKSYDHHNGFPCPTRKRIIIKEC